MNTKMVLQRAIGFIGLAVIVLLMTGCGATSSEPMPTSAPVPPTPTPTPMPAPPTSTPTPVPAPPMPGEWTASTDFGTLAFTVGPDSATVVDITYSFADWTCGGATLSGQVKEIGPPWSITNRQFTISNWVGLPMRIDGEFDEAGSYVSGAWEVEGQTCSGTWESRSSEN